MRLYRIAAFAAVLTSGVANVSRAQIYDLRDMSADDIRRLPLARTAIVVPGGILEQHGPYLPSYTDGFSNEYIARRVAEAIIARPGWVVVMFPPIPLGSGGFNQVGLRQSFPGTYHVHTSTLRAVFMDIASELGEGGFKYIFVVHGHGAPEHNIALHQAADFFGDTYGGRMANLGDLVDPTPVTGLPALLQDSARLENGLGAHGDAYETSRMLFVRPDLVRPGYLEAVPMAGRTWSDLGRGRSSRRFCGLCRIATARHSSDRRGGHASQHRSTG